MPSWAIEAEKLRRVFKSKKDRHNPKGKEFVALDGLDLQVERGERFGLLGPNGAGKTTLIKVLCTLLAPTAGRARVAGFDVEKDPFNVKRIINMVSGGETSGYGVLNVREQLWMFSQFYGVSNAEAFRVIDEMIEIVGLTEQVKTRINKLSTGQRQKMNFIRGFLNDPDVLFLDEPTLGLDVSAARVIRKYVRDWVDQSEGKTVLLTTHYMAEADQLCDRLAIIDHGRLVACDTPANLKRLVGLDTVYQIELRGGPSGDGQPPFPLDTVPGIKRAALEADVGRACCKATVILERSEALGPLLARLNEGQLQVIGFRQTEPTLEDVFLQLVGRRLEDEGGAA